MDKLVQGGVAESGVLQEILPGIAFCCIEDEFNNKCSSEDNKDLGGCDDRSITERYKLPQGFSKLFQLAQCIIQYLLHSQKKLTEGIKILQDNNNEMKKVYAKSYSHHFVATAFQILFNKKYINYLTSYKSSI